MVMDKEAMLNFSNRVFECVELIVKTCKDSGYSAEEMFSATQSLNKLMEEKKNG